jgi:hypothetical protein
MEFIVWIIDQVAQSCHFRVLTKKINEKGSGYDLLFAECAGVVVVDEFTSGHRSSCLCCRRRWSAWMKFLMTFGHVLYGSID